MCLCDRGQLHSCMKDEGLGPVAAASAPIWPELRMCLLNWTNQHRPQYPQAASDPTLLSKEGAPALL